MNKKLVAVVFGVVGCVACLLADISSSPGQRLEKFEPTVISGSISQPLQMKTSDIKQQELARKQGNLDEKPKALHHDEKEMQSVVTSGRFTDEIKDLFVKYYRYLFMIIAIPCTAFPLTFSFVVAAMIVEAIRDSRSQVKRSEPQEI